MVSNTVPVHLLWHMRIHAFTHTRIHAYTHTEPKKHKEPRNRVPRKILRSEEGFDEFSAESVILVNLEENIFYTVINSVEVRKIFNYDASLSSKMA